MYKKYIKRCLDIVGSLVLILPITVIIFIFGIFIKLEDHGSIFYCGKRLGKNQTVFSMVKLRTMKMNAPDIRNADGSTFNAEDDPRLLKIGKFLRKTSIDELPQIYNVFLGQMSFVGPRPDLEEQLSLYKEENKDQTKFEIKPGITGYAQCNGRNDLLWDEKLKMDHYYVEHCNLFLDIKILIKTCFSVLNSEGVNKKDYAE